ncbi:hypothetical protein TNIN_34081 [Trichonephila inaurata madagascariensis]|uniref:Uncharacterized protein n=1 Tax=Trichonephila inaurata madagascariensis TaxID=2747483 RepID=A0A8X6XRC3_9ARAC|nr:hypothetical protein TNIN_34081 [Trichonephila inaurata madagascariensis]
MALGQSGQGRFPEPKTPGEPKIKKEGKTRENRTQTPPKGKQQFDQKKTGGKRSPPKEDKSKKGAGENEKTPPKRRRRTQSPRKGGSQRRENSVSSGEEVRLPIGTWGPCRGVHDVGGRGFFAFNPLQKRGQTRPATPPLKPVETTVPGPPRVLNSGEPWERQMVPYGTRAAALSGRAQKPGPNPFPLARGMRGLQHTQSRGACWEGKLWVPPSGSKADNGATKGRRPPP